MHAERDVFDLILVNATHQSGTPRITDGEKRPLQFERVIEVAGLEHQWQHGNVIEQVVKRPCLFPDVAIDRQFAKLQPQT